jgi:nitrite reductase (NADH) large subunit
MSSGPPSPKVPRPGSQHATLRESARPPLRTAPPPRPTDEPDGPDSVPAPDPGDARPVVVVGAGPVGIHTARELLFAAPHLSVVLYGAEPWEPYNRVLLSELLAGEIEWGAIVNPAPLLESGRLTLRINNRIAAIDRIGQSVIDAVGNREHYSRLVLATGSSPHVPAFAKLQLLGVYTYRDVNDSQTLMTNALQSRATVVLGGGALGVEVARALKTQNPETQVIVVHRGSNLMNRELDRAAAELLEVQIRAAGIELLLRETISAIEGQREISGVVLGSGGRIDCDTLVICTGIERNTSLAREAGLAVGQGIKVDDRMRTSDRHIYAVGECAEHRGDVYGLLAPGIEQAKVAATNIIGGRARYRGSDHYLRLKVVKVPVTSIWRATNSESKSKVVVYRGESGSLRRLVVASGRLTGASAIGEWDEIERVQQLVARRERLWPWQLWRFRRKGRLWPARRLTDSANWLDSTMVCTCMGVSCGMLRQAMGEGHTTIAALRERTGACQGCGSCEPTVVSLLGSPREAGLIGSGAGLMLGGAALLTGALLLAILFAPVIPIGRSFEAPGLFDRLLLDATWKQLTGYALTLLATVSLLLPLRKRWPRFRIGSYRLWRGVHALLGAACAGVLVLHTGLRHGHNFDRVLMEVFLAVLLTGALLGALAWRAPNWLRPASGLHLLLVWMLPAFVAVHVLKVYYF